jgi:uncharacterized protein YggT (Ycf19 family)
LRSTRSVGRSHIQGSDPHINPLYERFICTFFDVARFVLMAECAAIFARVVASWVPDIPRGLATLLRWLTDGVLLPFQAIIPILGGMDLSPLAALFVLQAIAHYVPTCPTG